MEPVTNPCLDNKCTSQETSIMQCSSCGAVLPPGAKHCPACGVPAFHPSAFQESVSLPPSPDLHSARTIPGYTPSVEIGSAPPDPSSERTMRAGAYPPPVNNYGPPAYPQSPLPPPAQQQATQPNRGLPRGMT